ncbi:MAG: rhodanese-like domain-containing protein [Gammaproteobacteria bacterium]|nr:rhodanese-like domain-containing protein [Gammaproteobacteria bacterium]
MSIAEHLKKHFWWLPIGPVPEISASDLHSSLSGDDRPQIIDVRTAAEWRLSHIPGAANVSVKQLKRNAESLELDADRPVVAICLSAHRSIPAVRLLQIKGFPNAVQLQGGMLAWWKKDYPTLSAE